MITRETTTACLYAVTWQGTTHELSAKSARDLAAQVQQITSSRQAAGLARAAWGDDSADLQLAGVRLMAVGRIVRQTWRSVAAARTASTIVAFSTASNTGKAVIDDNSDTDGTGDADDAPATLQQSEPRSAPLRPLRAPPQLPTRQDGDTLEQLPWQDDA